MTISELYKKSADRGVLKAGMTEQQFRDNISTEEGLRSYYDYATTKGGMKFHDYDVFKERIGWDKEFNAQSTTQPTAQATATSQAPATPKEEKKGSTFVQPIMSPYAAMGRAGEARVQQIQADRAERERMNNAQLPVTDNDRQREKDLQQLNERINRDAMARNEYAQQWLPEDVKKQVQAGREENIEGLKQVRDELQNQRKPYMSEPKTLNEAFTNWQTAWSENTEEGQLALAERDAAIENMTQQYLRAFSNSQTRADIYNDVQKRFEKGELTEEEANVELNTRLNKAFEEQYGELMQEGKDQLDNAFAMQAYKADNGWLARQEERIREEAAADALSDVYQRLIKAQRKEFEQFKASVGNGFGATQAQSEFIANQQNSILGAALQLYQEAETRLYDTKKGEGNFFTFGKEILRHSKNKLGNLVSFGMSDVASTAYQVQVLKKIADAGAYDVPEKVLDENEMILYDAIVTQLAVETVRKFNTAYGAAAGQMTAEMLPFIRDIMVGKGLLSGATSAVEKSLLRGIAKRIGNGAWGKLLANAGKTGINLAESAIISAVSPMTIQKTLQEEAKIDPTTLQLTDKGWTVGKINTIGGGRAYLKTVWDQIPEYFTETGGLTQFFKGMLSATKLGRYVSNSTFGQLLNAFDNTNAGKLLKKTAYNGIWEEFGEELETTFYTAVKAAARADEGESAEAFKNTYEEFFSKDSMLPMLLSFSLPAIVGGVVGTGEAIKINREYDKAHDLLMNRFQMMGYESKEDREDLLNTVIDKVYNAKLVRGSDGRALKDYPAAIREATAEIIDKKYGGSIDSDAAKDSFVMLYASLENYIYADQKLSALQAAHAKKQRQVQGLMRDVRETEQHIADNTHTNGMMYHVTTKGSNGVKGYIVSGNVSLNEYDNGMPTITNRDVVTVKMEDGSVWQGAAADLDMVDVPQSAETISMIERRRLTAKMNNLDRFKVGDVIYITENGQPVDGHSSRVADITDTGIVTDIIGPDGKPNQTEIPHNVAADRLSTISDLLLQDKGKPYKVLMNSDGTGDPIVLQEKQPGVWTDVVMESQGQDVTYSQDKVDDMLATGFFTMYEGDSFFEGDVLDEIGESAQPSAPTTDDVASGNRVVSEEAGEMEQPIEQPAAPTPSKYPTTQEGKLDWGQMDVPTVTEAAIEKFGDKNTAKEYAELQIAQAKKAVVAANKKKATSTDADEFVAQKNAIRQEQQAAQEELSKWENVLLGIANYKTAEEQAGQSTAEQVVEENVGKTDKYQLSDELDNNGRQFVISPSGDIVFGEITDETSLAAAPILLSEGMITNPKTNDGYGLVHIEARHGDQIRNAGYPSVLEFIEQVAKNYEVIKEGKDRQGNQTYLLQLSDKHNNTLIVELSNDGSYWNINTAGIFKNSYGKNRKEVYNRHTTDKQSAENVEESQKVEQSGTTTSSSMNSPTPDNTAVFADKGTKNIPNTQEKTQKTAEEQQKIGKTDFSPEEKLAAAEAETDTNPTEAQKKAENYKQGHVTLWGLPFTIENPKGSVRRGTDANGKKWEQVMNNTYGKIRRTEGVDGDHIDVFFGPNLHSDKVFVVDQLNVDTKEFDEHKVMLGFDSMEEAQAAYLSNYEKGWQGMGPVTETTMDEFKKWIDSSHRKTKPFNEYKSVKQEGASSGVTTPVQKSGKGVEKAIENIEKQIQLEQKYRGKEKDASHPTVVNIGEVEDAIKTLSIEELEELEQVIPNIFSYDKNDERYEGVDMEGLRDDVELFIKWAKESLQSSSVTNRETTERTPREEPAMRIAKAEAKMQEFASKLGAQGVHLISDKEQLPKEEGAAYRAIRNGANVMGWYNPKTNQVYIYLPNANNLQEVYKTLLHEFVAHKGLRDMLGKEKFDQLCHDVWDMMSEQDKLQYALYVKNNTAVGSKAMQELIDDMTEEEKAALLSDTKLQLAAADEYMAHFAETGVSEQERSIWQRIVDAVRDLLRKAGINLRLTDADIARLLYESSSRLSNDMTMRERSQLIAKNNKVVENIGNLDLKARLNDDVMFKLGTQVADIGDNTLVGLHNLSATKLRKAFKQGGLANPSAAVIDIAKQDHEQYGEISLIMPSSLVDSATGQNAGTYTGDIWSPTYPYIERKMNSKGTDKYYETINKVFENAPVGIKNRIQVIFVNMLDNQGDPDNLAYWYMLEKGIAPTDVIINSGISDDIKQRFEPLRDKHFVSDMNAEERGLLLSLAAELEGKTTEDLLQAAQEAKARYEAVLANEKASGFSKRIATEAIDEIDTYGVRFNLLSETLRKINEAIDKDGGVDVNASINAAVNYVQENGLKDDFDSWLDNLDNRFGIEEVIFDGYNRNGDRKYIKHTLENASRIMNQQPIQNASSHGGLSATRGQLVERMSTLAQIRANKHRLAVINEYEDEQWKAMQDEWFNKIINPLSNMQQIDSNHFINMDIAEQRLLEAIIKKDPIAHLNREYGYSIAKDSEFAKSLKDLMQRLKELPSKYFETKFKRPVYLNEFVSAVVPQNLPQDLKDGLANAGVELYEYDESQDGSRREATLQATESDDVRFSIKNNEENLHNSKKSSTFAAEIEKLIESDAVSAQEVKQFIDKVRNGRKEKTLQMGRLRMDGTSRGNDLYWCGAVIGEAVILHQEKSGVSSQSSLLGSNLFIEVAKQLNAFTEYNEFVDALGAPIGQGQEAIVWVKDDDGDVVKALHYNALLRDNTQQVPAIIERISWFNHLFPENQLSLNQVLGLHNNNLYVEVTQGYVDGEHPNFEDWGEVDAFINQMKAKGFEATIERGGEIILYKDNFEVRDLVGRNVIKDEDGVFHVIDANISQEVKEKPEIRFSVDNSSDDIRFRISNENQRIFVSNAEKAVEGIKQDKATPQQWLAMLEKNGGIKAGEDKWLGLSEWLKEQDKKSITKQEILDFISENQIQIEEVEYVEGSPLEEVSGLTMEQEIKFGDYANEFGDFVRNEELTPEEAYQEMIDKYGEDFSMAFELEDDRIYPARDAYGGLTEAAKYFLGEDSKTIHGTRLQYTTKGLENNREIALTVPTIESWSVSDEIHFGDAGEGRAIAWVRFGEAKNISKPEQLTRAEEEYRDFQRKMIKQYGFTYVESVMSDSELQQQRELIAKLRQAQKEYPQVKSKVLVIDEIQSKRHQEGREKGYKDNLQMTPESLRKLANIAQEKYEAYTKELESKYKEDYVTIYPDLTDAERTRADELEQDVYSAQERLESAMENERRVPDAPFDKNWHELAMKRMLRYAAENGYDYVAWTTGAQQAERYNIGAVVDNINAGISVMGDRLTDINYRGSNAPTRISHTDDGSIISISGNNSENFAGAKNISDIVGKELSIKILSQTEKGSDKRVEYRDLDLSVGGEGMKGFYDRMLPSFVSKYTKKWGAKVQDINLPNLEESAQTMHAVNVTESMKEDVMAGQPMFRISEEENRTPLTEDKIRSVATDIWNKYQYDGELESTQDIAEYAEDNMPKNEQTQALFDAIDKWRDEAEEDRLYYGGRGDLEPFEDAVLNEVEKLMKLTDTPLAEAQQLIFDGLRDVAADAGIDIVEVSEEEALKAIENSSNKPLTNPINGKILGYAQGGTIYLTKAGMTPETVVHEYTHVWAKAMQRNNRAGWENIKEIFKQSPLWDHVKNDPNYKDRLTTDDAICSEVLARFSGKQGAERLNEVASEFINEEREKGGMLGAARVRQFINHARQAIKSFWKWVGKNLFGITKFDSMEDVADRVLYDLLNATELGKLDTLADVAEFAWDTPIQKEKMDKWSEANPKPNYDDYATPEEWIEALREHTELKAAYARALRKEREREIARIMLERAIERAKNADPITEPKGAQTMIRPQRMKGETAYEYAQRLKAYFNSLGDVESSRWYQTVMKMFHKDWIVTRYVDRGKPLWRFFDEAIKKGAKVTDQSYAYDQIFLSRGRIQYEIEKFNRNQLENLTIAMRDIIDSKLLDGINLVWQNMDIHNTGFSKNGEKLTPRDIIALYAQAKDCQEAIEKGLPDRGAAGFLKNVGVSHTEIINMVESKVPKIMIDNLWSAIRGATHFVLEYEKNAGFIDPKQFEENQRDYYVPERGWREQAMSSLQFTYGTNTGKTQEPNSAFNAALVKARGRQSLADDPFNYIASIAYSAIMQVEANKIGQSMLKFCLDNLEWGAKHNAFRMRQIVLMNKFDSEGKIMKDENGMPMFEERYSEPSAEDKAHDAKIHAEIKNVKKSLGKHRNALTKELEEHGESAYTEQLKREIEKEEAQIAYLQDTLRIATSVSNSAIIQQSTERKKQHCIYVIQDGKRYRIEFQDPVVANVFNKTNRVVIRSFLDEARDNIGAAVMDRAQAIYERARIAYEDGNISEQELKKAEQRYKRLEKFADKIYTPLSMMKNATNIYAGLLTQYNPVFALGNAARDIGFAIDHISIAYPELKKDFKKAVLSKELRQAVWQHAVNDKLRDRTFFTEDKYGKWLEEFFETGAATGYAYLPELRDIQRDLNKALKNDKMHEKIETVKGAFSLLTEFSENFTRFATHAGARENGWTATKAAALAKNITTNFDKRGEIPLPMCFAFLRASVNALSINWLMFKKAPKRFIYACLIHTVLGMVNQLLNPNDPDDELWISDYVRENNYTIRKVRIPVAHFFRAFHAIGVNMAMLMQGTKTGAKAFYDMRMAVYRECLPSPFNIFGATTEWDYGTNSKKYEGIGLLQNFAPSILSPITDIMVNRDFMGRTINKQTYPWNEDTKDIFLAKDKTHVMYKDLAEGVYELAGGDMSVKNKLDDDWLADTFNWSASSVEHFVEGYALGPFAMVGAMLKVIYNATQGTWPTLNDGMILRKFYSSYSAESAYNQLYWELNAAVDSYGDLVDEYKTDNKSKYQKEKQSEKYQVYTAAKRNKLLKKRPKENPTTEDVKELMKLRDQWVQAE